MFVWGRVACGGFGCSIYRGLPPSKAAQVTQRLFRQCVVCLQYIKGALELGLATCDIRNLTLLKTNRILYPQLLSFSLSPVSAAFLESFSCIYGLCCRFLHALCLALFHPLEGSYLSNSLSPPFSIRSATIFSLVKRYRDVRMFGIWVLLVKWSLQNAISTCTLLPLMKF